MKPILALLVALAPATVLADAPGGASSPQPTAPAAQTVLDCTKTKSPTITGRARSYSVTGVCDKITIASDGNTVTIDAAQSLSITGASNNVRVARIDSITTKGSRNTVTYGRSLTKAGTTLSTSGANNLVKSESSSTRIATTSSSSSSSTTVRSSTATTTTASSTSSRTSSGTGTPASANVIVGLDCAKNPRQVYADNGKTVAVIGACESVSIGGNDNSVSVASAKSLSVSGNDNKVKVSAVDALAVSGNENSIAWRQGVTGVSAKVTNTGNDNTVTRTK